MPLSYKFVSAATGLTVLLEDIDALICADFGKPCSDTDFSQEFTFISNVGDTAYASGQWDQAVFDTLMKPCDAKTRDITLKYLNGEYRYSCWY
jgi:hypothetical protein